MPIDRSFIWMLILLLILPLVIGCGDSGDSDEPEGGGLVFLNQDRIRVNLTSFTGRERVALLSSYGFKVTDGEGEEITVVNDGIPVEVSVAGTENMQLSVARGTEKFTKLVFEPTTKSTTAVPKVEDKLELRGALMPTPGDRLRREALTRHRNRVEEAPAGKISDGTSGPEKEINDGPQRPGEARSGPGAPPPESERPKPDRGPRPDESDRPHPMPERPEGDVKPVKPVEDKPVGKPEDEQPQEKSPARSVRAEDVKPEPVKELTSTLKVQPVKLTPGEGVKPVENRQAEQQEPEEMPAEMPLEFESEEPVEPDEAPVEPVEGDFDPLADALLDPGRLLAAEEVAEVKDPLKGIVFAIGDAPFTRKDSVDDWNHTRYRGNIEITISDGKLIVVNDLRLEEYLVSVVPSEMPSSWPMEALKAQAVAARTYAYYHLGDHANDGYDIRDTVEYQKYNGFDAESARTTISVQETDGQVLMWSGKLIESLYSSSTGGHTASNEDIWLAGRPITYLRGIDDKADGGAAYDKDSPDFNWDLSFTLEEIEAGLRQNSVAKEVLPATSLKASSIAKTGHVRLVQIQGSSSVSISGESFRKAVNAGLGSRKMLSTRFTLSEADGKFVVNGQGNGHHVGLSQWGAKGRAEKGATHEEILAAYYSGSTVADLNQFPSDSVRKAQSAYRE